MMLKIIFTISLFTTLIFQNAFASLLISNLSAADSLKQSRQLILVITKNSNSMKGKLQRYERNNLHDKWRVIGRPIKIVVGKNGLAANPKINFDSTLPLKKEKDLRTPSGIFTIDSAFGFSSHPDIKIKIPYLQLKTTSVCVDDMKSKYYNHIINTSLVSKVDWNSGEKMGEISLYRYGATIDYNRNKPLSGAGSCIFMHIWRNQNAGTAGCIAMSASHLKQILSWLEPKDKPKIVILTQNMYNKQSKILSLSL